MNKIIRELAEYVLGNNLLVKGEVYIHKTNGTPAVFSDQSIGEMQTIPNKMEVAFDLKTLSNTLNEVLKFIQSPITKAKKKHYKNALRHIEHDSHSQNCELYEKVQEYVCIDSFREYDQQDLRLIVKAIKNEIYESNFLNFYVPEENIDTIKVVLGIGNKDNGNRKTEENVQTEREASVKSI